MIIGQHLAPNTGDPSPVRYYTPWFPSQGNDATFVLEVIDFHDSSGTLSMQVNAQTKTTEDADPAVGTASTGTITLASGGGMVKGQHSATASACLELVRFEIEVGGDASNDWVHCRMLNVAWVRN